MGFVPPKKISEVVRRKAENFELNLRGIEWRSTEGESVGISGSCILSPLGKGAQGGAYKKALRIVGRIAHRGLVADKMPRQYSEASGKRLGIEVLYRGWCCAARLFPTNDKSRPKWEFISRTILRGLLFQLRAKAGIKGFLFPGRYCA